MEFQNVNDLFTASLNSSLAAVAFFIPRFITGLVVLVIGLIIASIVKQILLQVFKVITLDKLLAKYGVPASRGEEAVSWTNIFAEIARWFVIIVFLVPTADIWGLSQFVGLLNSFLAFIPTIIVSVLILLVGFIAGRIVYDLLLASVHGVSRESARTVAVVGKYTVIVFAVLIALNQLGIASDLIRILFGGIVASAALAAGLAFGLGGKDAAREILSKLTKRL